MFKRLKIGDVLKYPTKSLLQEYLDKKYEFKGNHNSELFLKKDTSFKYPYRFITCSANDNMQGAWEGYSWTVTKTPSKQVSFKGILCK